MPAAFTAPATAHDPPLSALRRRTVTIAPTACRLHSARVGEAGIAAREHHDRATRSRVAKTTLDRPETVGVTRAELRSGGAQGAKTLRCRRGP
jgi:hypothetical protein